jgi:hypothetical protein
MPTFAPLLALLISGIAAEGTVPITAGARPSQSTLATRGLVIVLRPSDADADELTRTALARVTGELTAARFQVTVLPLDPNLDPTPQVESAAPESQPVAAFAIARVTDAKRDTIAIWVSDRLGRRTTISRIAMRGDNISQDAEVLAIEAIELIRVSIAGLWPTPARTQATQLMGGGTSTQPAPASANGPEFSLGLGIAMLVDIGLPSPQWMGSINGMLMWPRGLAARARLSGLGPALTLSGDYGTAMVHRELATLGVAWVFWRHERVQSLISVAMGAEHLTADGAAADPARARTASAWSALGMAGIGAAVRWGAGISLGAEVNAVVTAPPVNLRIADTDTKPFSRPGVLVNVGLQVAF